MYVTQCRLCGEKSEEKFELFLLGKHKVKYYHCTNCRSLQAEQPYWLEEAYGIVDLLDTGRATRTLVNFFIIPKLLELLGAEMKSISVDFGGGSGLFARLMRDVGYDYHTCDKYGTSEFATGFVWSDLQKKVNVLSLFEVAEHFPSPAADWDVIFKMDPEIVIGTTTLYNGEGPDWGYLIPNSGQHVFFYTPAALAILAQRNKRHAYLIGGYFIILKEAISELILAKLNEWAGSQRDAAHTTFNLWLSSLYSYAVRDATVGQ
jgi:hypothetical protein